MYGALPLATKIAFATFRSSEVEALTGLTQDQARDWRRRGLLSNGGRGQPAYNAFDLAEISVRRGLNRLGIPLADTEHLMPVAVKFVVAEICRRTFDANAGVEDLLDELLELLAVPSCIIVMQDTEGEADAQFVDIGMLGYELTQSEVKFGPVWGIVNLELVAGEICRKSTRPLVSLAGEEAR